jgi:hypothetical protein
MCAVPFHRPCSHSGTHLKTETPQLSTYNSNNSTMSIFLLHHGDFKHFCKTFVYFRFNKVVYSVLTQQKYITNDT